LFLLRNKSGIRHRPDFFSSSIRGVGVRGAQHPRGTMPKAADKRHHSRKQKPSAIAPAVAEPAPRVVKIAATEARQKLLSDGLMNHTIGRLAAIMRNHGTNQPTDNELDFGIKSFLGLDPSNTAEVLLCTQMVGIHEVAMAMLTRAKMADGLPQMQESGTLAVKLFGMFERQFATLQKSRQPKQIVEVRHEHRHLHAHGTPLPGAGVVTQELADVSSQLFEPPKPRS
jgi:hypothetical protein